MEKLGQSINRFLERAGLKSEINANRKYSSLWEKTVGKHVGFYTRPVTLKEKRLLVEVSDSNWLYHLTLLKPRIINDFNKAAGSEIICEIKFMNTDFYDRDKLEKKEKEGFLPGCKNFTDGEARLDLEDEEKLEKALLLSPESFRHQLRNLFKNTYLRQKRAKK